ncbi:unnamed protein product [Echinostoma caproni]|uniref:AMP-binding_C domain-containing protein n=1 Tax=Echinostoma caproni TaxID=27848 RepID=A0A183B6D2_9TREM|nr:unnamed protein product [Echinostoma caproni]
MVYPVSHKLVDRLATCEAIGVPASETSISLIIYRPLKEDRFNKVLSEFPELRKPSTILPQVSTDILYQIVTRGTPVHCRPRRLAPDKLKVARAEFQHMLDLGITQSSSSQRALPVYRVPKMSTEDWRHCGDYRAQCLAAL